MVWLQAATRGSGILIFAVSYWYNLAKTGALVLRAGMDAAKLPFAQVLR
jgi:hypothetical protein